MKTTTKVLRGLVADDAAMVREGMVAMLAELRGVRVVGTAEDGEQAVALVASRRPHLVLMDLQMPRLNGLEATRRIRADFPAVRVIMITLHNSEQWRAAAAAAGVHRFIPKERLHDELPGALAHLFPGHAADTGE